MLHPLHATGHQSLALCCACKPLSTPVASAQAAMNNMTNELMLLGFATLLLLSFQKDIGRICSAWLPPAHACAKTSPYPALLVAVPSCRKLARLPGPLSGQCWPEVY